MEDEMSSSAFLKGWRGTYTSQAPCATPASSKSLSQPWRALLTWDDALVAILVLITWLLPSIAGVQQSGGQLLQRKKTSPLSIGMSSGAGQGQLHHTPREGVRRGQCSQVEEQS